MAFMPPSRICVSFGEADPERLLQSACAAAAAGEIFFEFCLEFLADPHAGPIVIREFLHRWPRARIIATCRREERCFHGTVEQQLQLLSASITAGIWGFDLEVETATRVHDWMRDAAGHCMRIVSYHNHRSTPPLRPLIRSLTSIPADMFKVAVTTRKPGVLCGLIRQAWTYDKPVMLLAMGPSGLPTRILGPVAGRSFTYASFENHEPTATGQPDAKTLREVYRLDAVDDDTTFIAGFPGSKAEMPAFTTYNKLLASGPIKAVYVPWHEARSIPPPLLRDASLRIGGVGLADELSRSAFLLADIMEDSAMHCGIVDTLWKARGKWCGGWKFGESVVALLVRSIGCGKATIRLAGKRTLRRKALKKLLALHGYPFVTEISRRAEVGIVLDHDSSIPDRDRLAEYWVDYSAAPAGSQFTSNVIGRKDLEEELIKQQMESWFGSRATPIHVA